MKTTIDQKLKTLTNDQLITLSEELRLSTVAEDALLRQVIKDTDLETEAPLLAFISIQGYLTFELADRLIVSEREKKTHFETCRVLNDRINDSRYRRDAIDM